MNKIGCHIFKKITVSMSTVIFLYACSPIGKVYHNMTARFNPYFIAYQKNIEIEKTIKESTTDDFDYILPVFGKPTIDKKAAIDKLADEQIKKASLSIQRHPNSRWTDDCFLLIAKGRFYMKDYKNAIETFKYVNTKTKTEDIKHQALLGLMRVFIDSTLFSNAIATADYLRKESLNRSNENYFNLLKTHYFISKKEYKKASPYLEKAIETTKKRSNRARLYFINGQLYQLKGNEKEAQKNYKNVLKSKPSYELSFYTKLNLASVSQLNDKSDIKNTKKTFKKLLKDIKNDDFQDRIYYEMAKFEIRQNNITQAIPYLKTSIQKNKINKKQKALSYLKLGEIYYEKLKKYSIAKLYYDSTVSTLPKTEHIFESVSKRQQSLVEFVKYINTITEEDSLQGLGKMDSIKLYAYLDQLVIKKNKEKEEELKKQAANSNSSSSFYADNTNTNNTSIAEEGTWYFYNPIALSQGKTSFISNWKDRPLEDNWRRSTKESTTNFSTNSSNSTDTKQTSANYIKITRADLLKSIPRTKEDFEKSDQRLQESYFQLGKIYHQELEEEENAIQAFEKLLQRYPENNHKVETLYFLYLIYQKQKHIASSDKYKNRVLTEYPNSVYASLIENPHYLSDVQRNETIIDSLYQTAFYFYEQKEWNKTTLLIDSISITYPKNTIKDKLAFLKTITIIQQEDATTTKTLLTDFIQSYPESPLAKQAQQMIQRLEKLPEGNLRRKEKKDKKIN